VTRYFLDKALGGAKNESVNLLIARPAYSSSGLHACTVLKLVTRSSTALT
jgi:hypothetical protein